MSMNTKWQSGLKIIQKLVKIFVISWFSITFLLFIISFTTIPFWRMYSLATEGADYDFEPQYIVLMGGSGMPGRSTLIRVYYTAKVALQYPTAKVIIAFPDDMQRADNQLNKVMEDLILRGVDANRILFEPSGTNSRGQALNIRNMFKNDSLPSLLIVSDPEHIFRSVKAFLKVGFEHVASQACLENDINVSLAFDSDKLGGKKYILDVGNSQQLRYQVWNHLIYEITLLREYLAIFYYKVQGWI